MVSEADLNIISRGAPKASISYEVEHSYPDLHMTI